MNIATGIHGKRSISSVLIGYDKTLLLSYIFLCVIGLYIVMDINSVQPNLHWFVNHLVYMAISLCIMFLAFRMPELNRLRFLIKPAMIVSIILLILVLIFGVKVNGAIRSLRVFGFSIQPSVIARIVLVLYIADYIDRHKEKLDRTGPVSFVKRFPGVAVAVMIIMGLIYAERHFSPLVVIGLTLMGILWAAKVRFTTILAMILVAWIGSQLVLDHGAGFRGERMAIFDQYSLYHHITGTKPEPPEKELKDYQVRESLTALANGYITGTGPANGRGKHAYLPEARTDYVFTIIGEEFGFLGALLVMMLHGLLFFRGSYNAHQHENLFLKLAGIGLALNIFINALINFGVSFSALPATGVTLPFVSYGGSSLVFNSFSVGLLMNISAKRKPIC